MANGRVIYEGLIHDLRDGEVHFIPEITEYEGRLMIDDLRRGVWLESGGSQVFIPMEKVYYIEFRRRGQ